MLRMKSLFFFYLTMSFDFGFFHNLNLSVNENPKDWDGKTKNSSPSDPWKILFSEGFESEESVINFKIEPWFFHCSVSSVSLVEVFERLGNFRVNDIVLRESVRIRFNISSCSEFSWFIGSSFSDSFITEWTFLWESTFVSSELVDIHGFSDQSVRFIPSIGDVTSAFWLNDLCIVNISDLFGS